MAYVDFQAIKRLCSLEMVANWLGLNVKNNRCECPVAEGGPRELVLSYDRGSWTCFGCKKKHPNKRNSGDQIQLVAHCLEIDEKKAAEHIQTKFHGYTPSKKGLPEDGLDYINSQHETVSALGFNTQVAEELGIGHAGKGTMRNNILVPVRDKTGKLRGYLGFEPGTSLKLPKDFRAS